MLELRHLRTLQALQQSGSLSAAADRLHVTQSALSHQLKELEQRLGLPLFERKSRPLRFTEAGRRLLALADEVLASVQRAEQALWQLAGGRAGRLYLAIECHSCFDWLMPAVERFREGWPEVELDFSAGFHFEPLPALAAGELDLVVTADPQPLKGITYLPLFRYESLLIAAPGHALAARERIEPADLADQVLITYPVERRRLDVFTRFLEPAGVEPAAVRTAELTLMMVQLAASGRGVACLPNWAVSDYRERGLIAARPLGQGLWSELQFAVRAEDAQRPYVQAFLEAARRHCFGALAGIRGPRAL
jgi:LysR family transcriptional regulator for metE and metH